MTIFKKENTFTHKMQDDNGEVIYLAGGETGTFEGDTIEVKTFNSYKGAKDYLNSYFEKPAIKKSSNIEIFTK